MIPRELARQILLARSTIAMLAALAISVLLAIAAAGMIASAAREIRTSVWGMLQVAIGQGDPARQDAWASGEALIFFVIGVILAVIAGALMFAVAPRGRRWWLIPAMLLLAGVLVLVPAFVSIVERLATSDAAFSTVFDRTQLVQRHRQEILVLSGLVVAAAIMPLGLLPSAALARSRNRLANLRFRRRRRRLRAWRQRT